MPYLYILQNNDGRYYVGITGLTPGQRLRRHNNGYVTSTKAGRPWEMIYTQELPTLAAARVLEKKIKSWKGGNAFEKFINQASVASRLQSD